MAATMRKLLPGIMSYRKSIAHKIFNVADELSSFTEDEIRVCTQIVGNLDPKWLFMRDSAGNCSMENVSGRIR